MAELDNILWAGNSKINQLLLKIRREVGKYVEIRQIEIIDTHLNSEDDLKSYHNQFHIKITI